MQLPSVLYQPFDVFKPNTNQARFLLTQATSSIYISIGSSILGVDLIDWNRALPLLCTQLVDNVFVNTK